MSLRFSSRLVVLGGLLFAGLLTLCAGGADGTKDAKEIVRTAMQAELTADLNDNTRWRYRDAQRDGTETVSIVVETAQGSVKRVISKGGQPLNAAEAAA